MLGGTAFRNDRNGGIAVILALALPVILIGVGGSLETSRAVTTRQRLASGVELTCAQAQAYVNARKSQDVKTGDTAKVYPDTDMQPIADRNKTAKSLTTATLTVKNTSDTNVHVDGTVSMPLIFSKLLGKQAISLSQARDCAVISTPAAQASNGTAPQLLISESFERPSHSVAYNNWSVLGGKNNADSWNGWSTQGAGIEINGQRELASNSIRFGDFFAELDSDCGTSANSGNGACRSNSTMSRYLDLNPGSYQIRYWYIARKRDPNQPGKVICGSKDSDVSWYQVDGQTNRIEVYVERKGSYTFASSNMVDVCVQADSWTERVINFTVLTPSEYRISWRAAGREDTFGGLIDYIRICRNVCVGS